MGIRFIDAVIRKDKDINRYDCRVYYNNSVRRYTGDPFNFPKSVKKFMANLRSSEELPDGSIHCTYSQE